MKETKEQATRMQLKQEVFSKERRKLRSRREGDRSAWFGLGMFGLVGWSVAIPAVAGVAVGAWLDANWPSQVSWKITLLFLGVAIGFANARRWMHHESEED
jgi:ATP synthase protein I